MLQLACVRESTVPLTSCLDVCDCCFPSIFINNEGRSRKSVNRASTIVIAVSLPIPPFISKAESERILNPTTRIIDVTNSAMPTEEKAYRTASCEDNCCSLQARRYLLRKWTVSSTTMPSVMPTTTAKPMFT